MATIVRYLTFVIVVTGCSFDSPWPEAIPPGPAPMPQPCGTNEPGVVLCVDFEDESLAAQAIDRSPNQNHAVAHDVDSTVRPPVGERAALLTSVSSLRVAESPTLDLATFSIEMWIYPDRPDPKGKGGDRIDHGLFDNYGHYTMRLREDLKVRCGVGLDGAARVSSESRVLGRTWSHVACTYANGEMRVYINGFLSDCQDLGTPTLGGNLGSAIGSEIDPAGFEGLRDRFLGGIDNVRVYDRALESARICAAAGQPAGSCADQCPSSGGGDEGSSGD